MRYLIDGYNLLFFLLDSNKPLRSQRQKVISSIQREFFELNLKGILVFDGSRYPAHANVSYFDPLVITYSAEGKTADEYILEQIGFARSSNEITVVSDDKILQKNVRHLGAKTLSLSGFIKILEKKRRQKKSRVIEKKSLKESQDHFNRLLHLFETRDQEEES